jgi:hypothetical protein
MGSSSKLTLDFCTREIILKWLVIMFVCIVKWMNKNVSFSTWRTIAWRQLRGGSCSEVTLQLFLNEQARRKFRRNSEVRRLIYNWGELDLRNSDWKITFKSDNCFLWILVFYLTFKFANRIPYGSYLILKHFESIINSSVALLCVLI